MLYVDYLLSVLVAYFLSFILFKKKTIGKIKGREYQKENARRDGIDGSKAKEIINRRNTKINQMQPRNIDYLLNVNEAELTLIIITSRLMPFPTNPRSH